MNQLNQIVEIEKLSSGKLTILYWGNGELSVVRNTFSNFVAACKKKKKEIKQFRIAGERLIY